KRWTLRQFNRAFGELEGAGFALADWSAPLLWLPRGPGARRGGQVGRPAWQVDELAETPKTLRGWEREAGIFRGERIRDGGRASPGASTGRGPVRLCVRVAQVGSDRAAVGMGGPGSRADRPSG